MPDPSRSDLPSDTAPERAPTSALDVMHLRAVQPQLLIAVMVALAGLVLLGELPGRPLILHALQKLAHPTVFGLIAIGVLALEQQRMTAARPLWLQYLLALLVATGIGALTELGQLFTHRDPSLRDMLLDARGTTCALAYAAVFDNRCRAGVRPVLRRSASWVIALGMTALILTPLAWTAAGYAQREWRFPILFAPASRLDLLFVGLTSSAPELSRVPGAIARAAQETGLRVPLQSRPYAGVTLDEPSADWRGYRILAVEVGNNGRTDLTLRLRIHDRQHDWTATDRYNGELRLAAGQRRTFEIALADVERGPRGRLLDLGHVAGVSLYRAGPEGPGSFWLHRIALR
ncbi:MAG: VanZ family protein [Proteobacteria bacterium]|nr:VanZ family protein [Pseudomonadota bacterium]